MDEFIRRHDERDGRFAAAAATARVLPPTRPSRLLLTVEEAAERIGICRAYMFKLIREGDIRSVKVGRLRRVTPAALDDFVAQLSGNDGKAPA